MHANCRAGERSALARPGHDDYARAQASLVLAPNAADKAKLGPPDEGNVLNLERRKRARFDALLDKHRKRYDATYDALYDILEKTMLELGWGPSITAVLVILIDMLTLTCEMSLDEAEDKIAESLRLTCSIRRDMTAKTEEQP